MNRDINKEIAEWINYGKCMCDLCERGRRFAKIIDTLPSSDDKSWMVDFYEHVMSVEEDHGLQEYWLQQLNEQLEKQGG